MNGKKKIDYRHYICIGITFIFLLLSIFYFKYGILRIGESLNDLYTSFLFWIDKFFDLDLYAKLTINEFTALPFTMPFNLPNTWEEFKVLWSDYWYLIFTKENFNGYILLIGDILYYLSKILMLLLPFIILIMNIFNSYFKTKDETIKNILKVIIEKYKGKITTSKFYYELNIIMCLSNSKINKSYKFLLKKKYITRFKNKICITEKGKKYYKKISGDSTPLKIYKNIENKVYFVIKKWILNFIKFLKDNDDYLKIWILLWMINFNIITIIIEFIAYYFYFTASWNIISLYVQVLKLLIDLSVMINFIPDIVWLYIVIKIFSYFRAKRAVEKLRHYERRNRGLINSLGLVVLICGNTGKGKNLIATDMTLSKQVMLRNDALEIMQNNKVKFSNFNWEKFNNIVIENYNNRIVYKNAHVDLWIKELKNKFKLKPTSENIFEYDIYHYSMYYYNGLHDEYIFDVLCNYTKALLVYITKTSLILSNYPIKTDDILIENGKFPFWITDFFSKDKKLKEAYTQYSHILDFNIIRLGKKMGTNTQKSGAYEYGILVLDEYGKEKGNQITNRELKINDDECNAKNELSELFFKTYRHLITIDKETFGWTLMLEQRPESVGADSREIAEKIVHIRNVGENKNTLLFFSYDEMIYEYVKSTYDNIDLKYKTARTDNTLFIYLFRKICSSIISNHERKVNKYGYVIYKLQLENSTMDNSFKDVKYYRMNAKIFDNRYKTNCFEDPYHQRSLNTPLNIDDLDTYKSINQTTEEIKKQNSRWSNKLLKILENDEEK